MKIEHVAKLAIQTTRIEFETQAEFENLMFLEGNSTRFLSQEFSYPWKQAPPTNLGRTLGNILDRMRDKGWSISTIKSELADYSKPEEEYPKWIHDPHWFRSCFEPNDLEPLRFGSLMLRYANVAERIRSEKALFAISDGCHRALSLGFAFRSGIPFQKVSGILLELG